MFCFCTRVGMGLLLHVCTINGEISMLQILLAKFKHWRFFIGLNWLQQCVINFHFLAEVKTKTMQSKTKKQDTSRQDKKTKIRQKQEHHYYSKNQRRYIKLIMRNFWEINFSFSAWLRKYSRNKNSLIYDINVDVSYLRNIVTFLNLCIAYNLFEQLFQGVLHIQ